MKAFWVEGLFLPRSGLKRGRRTVDSAGLEVEPFARVIWAETAEEAAIFASETLEGGSWVEGPRVTLKSEEQRMRAAGAPELPGIYSSGAKTRRAVGGGTHARKRH